MTFLFISAGLAGLSSITRSNSQSAQKSPSLIVMSLTWPSQKVSTCFGQRKDFQLGPEEFSLSENVNLERSNSKIKRADKGMKRKRARDAVVNAFVTANNVAYAFSCRLAMRVRQ